MRIRNRVGLLWDHSGITLYVRRLRANRAMRWRALPPTGSSSCSIWWRTFSAVRWTLVKSPASAKGLTASKIRSSLGFSGWLMKLYKA
jgi:hypothetical protein